MAFVMLKHASRPKSSWNMAFDYATHVWDRCPRRSNERSVTPFEAFFRQKPDVTDLRIFGCLCYAHVSPDEHHQLEPRAQRGVFVGFDEERRSVWVVVDGQRKFTVHRSVVWYEQPLLDTMTRCAHSAYSDQQPILDMHGVKSYGDLFKWASKIPCRHVFFVRLRCLDDLEKFMSTWSEFPWNYQGETSFSIEESTNSRLRKLFMSSQWPLFFFSSFLVFEGFACIYGFLITWGTPF